MRLGLRARVALSFGLLSLAVAVVVSGTFYAFARYYLVAQRESTALTRALLDARALDATLASGEAEGDPGAALEQLPSVETSQPLVRVDGVWYTRGVTVSPDDLPAGLLALAAEQGGASQRFAVGGSPYFVVAVPLADADTVYVEVFSLSDLNGALVVIGWLLVAAAILAFGVGTLLGQYAGARLLRPLRELGEGATRLADGDLDARIKPSGDPDLDPISTAFNDMAGAVQSRIARETRFAANVSHELRSPLTTIVGTAEILERRKDRLPERDGELVTLLASQVRRLSRTVLDLLEIARISQQVPVQLETADVTGLVAEVMRDRGQSLDLLHGDEQYVRTDARRVERIVANLVDNADRHGGGLVGVTVERDGTVVRLCVDDGGPGIPPEEAAQVFEPFTRGSTAVGAEGAGLGLALVREQARLLGATVRVEQAPAGGARFVVEIPEDRP
ncbi:MAG: HAMP domain-containing sensor histidine kinase [Candidatus Nanopelagicales bacterium]